MVCHGRKAGCMMTRRCRIAVTVIGSALALFGACVLYTSGFGRGIPLACPIYVFSGYYCPGCGAGRACNAILHGQLYQAFRWNALLVILMPFLALYYGICVVQWVLCGRETFSSHISWKIPAAIFCIVIIYGVIRNIGVYPFTLLAPTLV